MKKFFDEIIQDERISDTEIYFKTEIIYGSLDIIIIQLSSRFSSLNNVNKLFSFLLPVNLINFTDEELKSAAAELSQLYPDDFSLFDLQDQIIVFKTLFKTSIPTFKTILEIATFLIIHNSILAINFSELSSAYLLFLILPVTTAAAKRSFSKLKVIKNYLRSIMEQSRLSEISIISIEKN